MSAQEPIDVLKWIEESDVTLDQLEQTAQRWKVDVQTVINTCRKYEPYLTAYDAIRYKSYISILNKQAKGIITDPVLCLTANEAVANLSMKKKKSEAEYKQGHDLRYFSVDEVSQILQCSKETVSELWRELEVGHRRSGSQHFLFTLSDIHNLRNELGKVDPEKYLKGKQLDPLRKTIFMAIMNQKGGVGKTTTTLLSAQYLCLQGLKVLAVDLDAQGSLSTYVGARPQDFKNSDDTVMRIINSKGNDPESAHKAIHKTRWQNLDIMYAHPDLVQLDTDYYTVDPEKIKEFIGISPKEFEKKIPEIKIYLKNGYHHILKRGLSKVQEDYDVIIFDTPPSFNVMTTNVLFLMDMAVVPVLPQPMTDWSIGQLIGLMTSMIEQMQNFTGDVPHFQKFKYLPSMVEKNKNGDILKGFCEQYGSMTYKNYVHHRKSIVDSSAFFLSPVESHIKNSSNTLKATREMLEKAYSQIEDDLNEIWNAE